MDQNDCLWLGTDAVQSGQKPARGVVKLCETDNLAARPGVTATLSSTSGDPFDAAANAIDSDYRTNDIVASGFAVSLPEDTPHLDLDLGALRSVEDVILWARTDSERLDLQNVHIWASPSPFTTDDWTLLRDDPAVSEHTRLGSHGGKRTLSVGVDHEVRYLRVEVDFTGAPDSLQFAEVAVTGNDADPVDPLTLTNTFTTRERVVLRWEPSGPVTIFRDDVEIGTDNDGWFTDRTVAPGTTYRYRVETPGGKSATIDVTTEGGAQAPLNLSSTLQTRERVVLRWDPSDAVDIYRNDILIGSDDDGRYTDRTVAAGTSYTYRVEAAGGRTAEITVNTQP